jgi:hypothetical protein
LSTARVSPKTLEVLVKVKVAVIANHPNVS